MSRAGVRVGRREAGDDLSLGSEEVGVVSPT